MTRQGLRQPLDLLRQRRLQRGLAPAEAVGPLQAAPLWRRGATFGAIPLAGVIVLGLVLQVQRWQLAGDAATLSSVPEQIQGLDGRLQRARRQLRQLERSSEGLARGIVAVQSGSALLTELARVTPGGVQINALQVQGDQLVLKGVAVDPAAFRRVNALQLLLARSPLIQSGGVQPVKLSRDKPADPLSWELTARFANLKPLAQGAVLAELQADGLARRVQVLQRAGVLR
jgi:type IV pilus assembly protein PilN